MTTDTRALTLADIAHMSARALEEMQQLVRDEDWELAQYPAAVVSACALVRLAGSPHPRPVFDPYDDEPHASQAEREQAAWRERNERDDR